MRHSRLHWDSVLGWVIDVEVSLSDDQLRRVCGWAVPRQIDRWKSLPPGCKKDELASAIKLLQQCKIRQRIVEQRDGTACLFKSDKSTGKIFSIGG